MFNFPAVSSPPLSHRSSNSGQFGSPIGFGQGSSNSYGTPLFGTPSTSASPFGSNVFGNSTGAFGTRNANLNPSAERNSTGVFRSHPHFSGALHQSASQSAFSFPANATHPTPFGSPLSAQLNVTSPFPSDRFSTQTPRNQENGFSSNQSNSTSPFPSVLNPFSARTQSSGVTTFSPFSTHKSNANSPFSSVHSNPFSAQTQSSVATGFSPFSSQSNSNFPFPSGNSNLFFAQTQRSRVTSFSPFSSQPNANSPFPSDSSTANSPFATQNQSNSTIGFSPFSSQSNANSPFPSASSTANSPFATQNQSNSTKGFSPFYSQSYANSPFPSASSIANSPFATQTQSSSTIGFSPFSSQSNANSHSPSVSSNPGGECPACISSFNFNQSKTNPTLKPVSSPSTGSRVAPYASTKEPEGNGVFHSISSMPIYESKSHEELRFDDYWILKKDGQSATTQAAIGIEANSFRPFTFPPVKSTCNEEPEGNFHSISTMPDYIGKSHEELRLKDYRQCKLDGQSVTTQAAIGIQANSSLPSAFPPVEPTCTNFFPATVSPPINSQSSAQNPFFTSPFTLSSTTTPSVSTSVTPGLLMPSNSATTQENIFAPKCSLSGFDLSNSQNIVPSLSSFVSNSSLSQVTAPGSTSCLHCNCIKTQSPQPTLIGPSTNVSPVQLNPMTVQQTLQPLPDAVQMPSNHPGSMVSVQYGISSLCVSDKAAPSRRRSLLIVRHSSLNQTKMLTPKYNPDSNNSRVPFFMAGENKGTGVAKTNSVIIPIENPRSWIHPPTKEWPQSYNSNTLPEMEHTSINVYEDGNIVVELSAPSSSTSLHLDTYIQDGNVRAKQTQTDVDAIMPKLKYDDYYTEPTIQELAAKEKEEPGFCLHVKDFVIGRRGFGAIKFTGETDIRGLDLDTVVQFNHREVIVYMDDSKKPELGKGLNQPAEVTLLNLKCIDKKTGKEYKDGPLVDKYKNLLIRKSADQGAEFVSYDPVEGEWKFKVHHF